MPQTTMRTKMEVAVPGMLADDTMTKDCLSVFQGEASAEIPFGVMVARGSAQGEAVKLAAQADPPIGIVVFEQSHAQGVELGTTGLKPGTMFSILNKGRIYVFPEEAVVPGGAVRYRAVAAGAEVAGAFRTTQDTTDTCNISSFARWLTAGSSTSPAVLEIDMTNAALKTNDT